MEVDERTRRLVHGWAASTGGADVADALMSMLPPFTAGDLATRADLEQLGSGLRGEMISFRAELRGEMAELRGELRGEMAEVRGEMAEVRGEMGELRGEMGELRGEMGELSGEMRGLLPRLYAANLVGMVGVAGLVLAAARFS